MKYDFPTVELGGFTAPGLPLARWSEFYIYGFWDKLCAVPRSLSAMPVKTGIHLRL